MKSRIVPAALLLMCTHLWAQEDCGTTYSSDPFFNQMHFLQYLNGSSRSADPIQLPVIARIVRHDDGTGGLKPAKLQAIFDTLNQRFSFADIQFYECGEPEFVDVNVFYDFNRDLYADSLVTYNIPNVINIYFINKVLADDDFICGYASFPWRDQEYVVVKNSCAENGSTLAHELGHYLGLLHTHETANGFELVDGSNCTFTGDEICDTPADPRLRSSNISTDCKYVGNERDLNRDQYEPDPRNIMSYSRKSCRDVFSPEQVARMQYYIDRDRKHLGCELTASEEAVEEVGWKVFPNPAADVLFIEYPTNRLTTIQARIYSVWGQHIPIQFHAEGDGLLTVIVSDLPPGMYVCEIDMGHQSAHRIFLRN